MIDVNAVCNDVDILNIIRIFKILINLAMIIVPVILVIFISIEIVKAISSGDLDTKKLWNNISKKMLAGVLVFLVPIILNFVLNIIPTGTLYYVDCYNNATSEQILYISSNNAFVALNNFEQALEVARNQVNQTNYDNAYKLYDPARIAVNKISEKETREIYQETLATDRELLEEVREALIEEESVVVIPPQPSTGDESGEGYVEGNKYTYDYIKSNLPSNLSSSRKDIVLTAAGYVGDIPYYWGGTATSPDFNTNRFGSTVTADRKGRNKKGLDCSHFVDFVFWQVTGNNLGNGNTTYIWNNYSYEISESELIPGDIGFLCPPSSCDSGNHVGIYAGKDSDGNKIWIHESGSPINNVTMNNFNFSYFRRVNILN